MCMYIIHIGEREQPSAAAEHVLSLRISRLVRHGPAQFRQRCLQGTKPLPKPYVGFR